MPTLHSGVVNLRHVPLLLPCYYLCKAPGGKQDAAAVCFAFVSGQRETCTQCTGHPSSITILLTKPNATRTCAAAVMSAAKPASVSVPCYRSSWAWIYQRTARACLPACCHQKKRRRRRSGGVTLLSGDVCCDLRQTSPPGQDFCSDVGLSTPAPWNMHTDLSRIHGIGRCLHGLESSDPEIPRPPSPALACCCAERLGGGQCAAKQAPGCTLLTTAWTH